MLQMLLRDHLFLRQEVAMVAQPLSMVVLFRSDSVKAAIKHISEDYANKAPEPTTDGNGRKKYPPHPYGFKKVHMWSATLRLLSKLTVSEETKEELTKLMNMPAADMDLAIGGYKCKYKEPLSERPWKWDLVLSAVAPESMRQAISMIIKATKALEAADILVDVRRERQGLQEQELWKHLKKLPKKQLGSRA